MNQAMKWLLALTPIIFMYYKEKGEKKIKNDNCLSDLSADIELFLFSVSGQGIQSKHALSYFGIRHVDNQGETMHSHFWNALGWQSSLLQKNSTDRICKYEALQPISSRATPGLRIVTFLKHFGDFLKIMLIDPVA